MTLHTLIAATLLGLAGAVAAQGHTPAATRFHVERLADGVHAVIRDEPPGLMVDANNLVIINDDDVVVVDANGAPSITRAVIESIRQLTDKPVRTVIFTHAHDDHLRGARAYREAFPGVEFVASRFTRDYLAGAGADNRVAFLREAPAFASYLRDLTRQGKGLAGGPLGDEERQARETDLALVDLIVAEAPQTATIPPTLIVDERLTLQRGQRVIDIRCLGGGHTAGDLIVHLPREGIVATGDLVGHPVPLVGHPQSRLREWADTLRRLAALDAKLLVPGHGPVLRGNDHPRQLAALFDDLTGAIAAARAAGKTFEAARASIDLSTHTQALAGDSPMRRLLFENYVRGPGLEAAWAQADDAPSAVVGAFHDALHRGDASAAAALLDDAATIHESGHAESRGEYLAHHLAADIAFARATRREVQQASTHCERDLCLVLAQTRTTGEWKGKAVKLAGVESTVLRRTEAGWRILHAHWSSQR